VAVTYTAEQLVNQIASLAEAIAFQSGTASSELAGQMVSVLARDPSLIDRFMRDGSEMFLDGTIRPEVGRFSWYGQNGQIVTPEFMRRHLGKMDH
jgi:hypothetical protein